MSKKKIFIVEDNDLNLKLFNDILTSNDFETAFTTNGFEAHKMIKDNKPDVIIMDIQLHGISGFEIIKELKKDDDVKDIPVIAVTAFAMKDDKEKILNSGFESYIPKPISISNFLSMVTNISNKIESPA